MPKIRKLSAGMTLIEVLLVISILLVMAGIMVGLLNPIALVNKGRDARRKKDINRIKIAMEGYMADNDCFPTGTLLAELNSEEYCESDVFAPWLNPWPCDPMGQSYMIVVEESVSDCPDWFKVFVWLENRTDNDILEWWYDYEPGAYHLSGGYTNTTVNHGISSTNVLWYERVLDGSCLSSGVCFTRRVGEEDECNSAEVEDRNDCEKDDDYLCFLNSGCRPECEVSCCENGRPCD